eukprot:1687106-Rhodomonas_salina.3
MRQKQHHRPHPPTASHPARPVLCLGARLFDADRGVTSNEAAKLDVTACLNAREGSQLCARADMNSALDPALDVEADVVVDDNVAVLGPRSAAAATEEGPERGWRAGREHGAEYDRVMADRAEVCLGGGRGPGVEDESAGVDAHAQQAVPVVDRQRRALDEGQVAADGQRGDGVGEEGREEAPLEQHQQAHELHACQEEGEHVGDGQPPGLPAPRACARLHLPDHHVRHVECAHVECQKDHRQQRSRQPPRLRVRCKIGSLHLGGGVRCSRLGGKLAGPAQVAMPPGTARPELPVRRHHCGSLHHHLLRHRRRRLHHRARSHRAARSEADASEAQAVAVKDTRVEEATDAGVGSDGDQVPAAEVGVDAGGPGDVRSEELVDEHEPRGLEEEAPDNHAQNSVAQHPDHHRHCKPRARAPLVQPPPALGLEVVIDERNRRECGGEDDSQLQHEDEALEEHAHDSAGRSGKVQWEAGDEEGRMSWLGG